jgi:hypothetical protein
MQEIRLALKAHVIVERDSEEDDYVLIDGKTGRMCACNETASAVVPQLRDGSTIERLVQTLVARFAVTREIATRDMNAFLDVLAAEGLLDAERDAGGKRTSHASTRPPWAGR